MSRAISAIIRVIGAMLGVTRRAHFVAERHETRKYFAAVAIVNPSSTINWLARALWRGVKAALA